MLEHPALKKIQLQAASTQIKNQSRLNLIAQRPGYCRTNKPRFLLAADYFEFNTGLPPNTLHESAIIASFPRSSRRNGTIGAHVMLIHPLAKSLEGARGASNRLRVEKPACKRVVA